MCNIFMTGLKSPREYKRILGNTRKYQGIQGYTGYYKGIQGITRVYRGLQGAYRLLLSMLWDSWETIWLGDYMVGYHGLYTPHGLDED